MEIKHNSISVIKIFQCLKEDCEGTVEFQWIDIGESCYGGFCDKCELAHEQYPSEWTIKTIGD